MAHVLNVPAETMRQAHLNFPDASQDLNELLGGLSPQRWGALPATRRKALLQQLWSTVRRKKQDLLFM